MTHQRRRQRVCHPSATLTSHRRRPGLFTSLKTSFKTLAVKIGRPGDKPSEINPLKRMDIHHRIVILINPADRKQQNSTAVHTRRSRQSWCQRYIFSLRAGSAITTVSLASGCDVYVPLCFRQKLQLHARTGISAPSRGQTNSYCIFPQWHPPVICCIVGSPYRSLLITPSTLFLCWLKIKAQGKTFLSRLASGSKDRIKEELSYAIYLIPTVR